MDSFIIRSGAEYIYLGTWPAGRRGHSYRAVGVILDVPSYQEKILVECLSGPDIGLHFTCSPANFATRYEPVELPAVKTPTPEPVAEKSFGYVSESWRTCI